MARSGTENAAGSVVYLDRHFTTGHLKTLYVVESTKCLKIIDTLQQAGVAEE